MSVNSSIEWTDASWNPIRARNLKTGKIGWHCEHATTGCEFCYSEGFNKRLGTGLPFKPGHRKDIEIFLDEDMLTAPLRWKKPRKIFVCSMTDLFADFVQDEWIDKMFAVMALCPQHTFQVLTKRAERMRGYLTETDREREIAIDAHRDLLGKQHLSWQPFFRGPRWLYDHGRAEWMPRDWTTKEELHALWPEIKEIQFLGCKNALPLPNVWLGVSCERQEEADARIPLLLQTPAAVRFISAEPLLGPIDLHDWCTCDWHPTMPPETTSRIDWVIVGGESGSHARPMHPQWARDLRDQCQAAGVPFFYKQSGEFASVSEVEGPGTHFSFPDGSTVRRVGKKAAGRLLDGREWNEFPAVAP